MPCYQEKCQEGLICEFMSGFVVVVVVVIVVIVVVVIIVVVIVVIIIVLQKIKVSQ